MNVFENVCSVCQNKNELEAIVCGHCGAALEDPYMDPGAKTNTTNMPALAPESIADWSIAEAAVPDSGIAVYMEGAFNPVYIDSKGEFVIGRQVGTTPQVSEALLDLSAAGGYHLGLSRRHVVIRRIAHGYEVLDLGSANGTWLNDEKLISHKSYPLASGSHLRLGSMRLFVLYHPIMETKEKP